MAMKTPYIVGSMKECTTCGKEFPRAMRRHPWCEDCTKAYAKDRNRRYYDERKAKAGLEAPPKLRAGNRGRLPGGTRLITMNQGERVLRKTHITFLPTCSICHNYPAQLVAGKWICGGQHG